MTNDQTPQSTSAFTILHDLASDVESALVPAPQAVPAGAAQIKAGDAYFVPDPDCAEQPYDRRIWQNSATDHEYLRTNRCFLTKQEAADGAARMLAALSAAPQAGERERAAQICEAMRPAGGRAWTEAQAACHEALSEAAKTIRAASPPLVAQAQPSDDEEGAWAAAMGMANRLGIGSTDAVRIVNAYKGAAPLAQPAQEAPLIMFADVLAEMKRVDPNWDAYGRPRYPVAVLAFNSYVRLKDAARAVQAQTGNHKEPK